MPITRELTPEELKTIELQGYNPDNFRGKKFTIATDAEIAQPQQAPATKSFSTLGAVGKSLQQKAGGIAGAGVGAIGAPALGGALIGGPVGFLGGLGLGIGGALAGGYVGQKAQEALEGQKVAEQLSQEAAQAQEEHPVATGIGDVTASMLASGGAFSPATTLRGIRGAISPLAGRAITAADKAALQNVAIQAGLMPAINTGISVAEGEGIPSIGSLAEQAAAGALFAKPSFLGRLANRPEVKKETVQTEDPTAKIPVEEAKPAPIVTDWKKMDANGKPLIDDTFVKVEYNKLHPKPDITNLSDTERYKALTEYKHKTKVSIEAMRDELNEFEIKRQLATKTAEQPVIKIPETPTTNPTKAVTPTTETTPKVPVTEPVKPPIVPEEAPDIGIKFSTAEDLQNKLDERTQAAKVEDPRVIDFKKAQAELVSQQYEEPIAKPLAPNTLKVLNPETLLPSEVTRPEVREAPLPLRGEEGNFYAKPEESARTTEQQRDLLRRFMDTSKEIQTRTAYGQRNVTAAERSYIAAWSNSEGGWYLKGWFHKPWIPERPTIGAYDEVTKQWKNLKEHNEWLTKYRKEIDRYWLKPGEEVNLDANEVLLPARSKGEAFLMAKHLPPLPLYGNAFEKNPLAALRNREVTIDEVQKFYEGMQSGSNLIKSDIPQHVSDFMDAIRSPEQSDFHAKSLGQLPTGEGINAIPPTKHLGTVNDIVNKIRNSQSKLAETARGLKIDDISGNVKVIVSHEKTTAVGKTSHYSHRDDVIYLSPLDEGNAGAVLHEIAHAATIKKFPKELIIRDDGIQLKANVDRYLREGSNENIKEILRCYLETAKQLGIEDQLFKVRMDIEGPEGVVTFKGLAGSPHDAQYFLSNIRGMGYYASTPAEFIAGVFDDPRWRMMLSKLDSGLKDNKSLWSRLYEALKRLVTGDIKPNNMLERVLKPTEELIAQERPGQNATTSRNITEGNRDQYSRTDEGQGSPENSQEIRSEEGPLPSDSYRSAKGGEEQDLIPESVKKTGVSFAPFLAGRFDRILSKHNDPVGRMVVDKLHKWHGDYDILKGRWGNALIPIIDKSGLNPEQVTRVLQHNHEISNFGKTNIKLSPAEASLSEAVKKHFRTIGEDIQKEGPGIRLQSGETRKMKLKEEGHIPPVLNQDVVYEWTQNQNSAKSKQLDQIYIDHQVKQGMGEEEAANVLYNYKLALGNQTERSVAYNAIRRAEGNGLPWELLDQNLASLNTRYSDRAARDVSFYKHLQSDPKIRKALDLVDETGHRMSPNQFPEILPINGSDEVTAAMRSVHGYDIPLNPTLMAAARAAGNTVMGIGTAARNVITVPGIAVTYMQTGQLKYLWKAITHMNDARARALATNAVKPNFQEAFDAAGYRRDDPNPIINFLNKYSAFMRKYQGRDLSDRVEAEYLYSLGELLATDNIAKAQAGNLESRRFLQKFGDLVEGGPERLFKGTIKPRDVELLAKRFVDATRGTYSAEGLPSWAIEGPLAPFAALSKFSIEKSNTVWKDVIEPMKQGIYGPFLRYSLGSLGVGVLIEKMNELLSNKRGADPTVNETLAGLTPETGTAKAISLLQLASFAGIIGDGAKAAMQMYQGKELRYNQPLSLPLYTMITDTIMGNMKDAAAAIQDGQDPFQVMGLLATTIAGQSVQTLRYVDANLIHPEETKRKEKFRDVNVFQQMEGRQAGPVIKSNPFIDIETKEFKRTGDINRAAELLPGILQKAMQDSNGDPYELGRILRGIKNNSYQTMPSFQNLPASFLKYIERLKATQGEEAAAARLADYINQNMVNKAKASLVP